MTVDKSFFSDTFADGVKGLVFIGHQTVVYRRDDKTKIAPLKIDLPGGKIEKGETPFEAFRREVREEVNIDITTDSIVYVRHYPPTCVTIDTVEVPIAEYFVVAKLPARSAQGLKLGDEGSDLQLMSIDDYLMLPDAIPMFQQRAADYMHSLNLK